MRVDFANIRLEARDIGFNKTRATGLFGFMYNITTLVIDNFVIDGDFLAYHLFGGSTIEKLVIRGRIESNILATMFASNVKRIDLSELDTSKIESMNSMFIQALALEEIKLGSLKSVKNMDYIFSSCFNLRGIEFTSELPCRLESMDSAFLHCKNIEKLDMSGFKVHKNLRMGEAFNDCGSLVEVKLPDLSGCIVTDMHCTFKLCHKLQSLDLSKLELHNYAKRYGAFDTCYRLKDVKMPETQPTCQRISNLLPEHTYRNML